MKYLLANTASIASIICACYLAAKDKEGWGWFFVRGPRLGHVSRIQSQGLTMNTPTPCIWTYKKLSMFTTTCGQDFLIDQAELGDTYKFCPACGGKIVEPETVSTASGPEDDDYRRWEQSMTDKEGTT